MYGGYYSQDMGSLIVSQVFSGKSVQLTNITGDKGQDWKRYSLKISTTEKFNVSLWSLCVVCPSVSLSLLFVFKFFL